jgi:hypothetical protein
MAYWRARSSRYNKELTPAGRAFMIIMGLAFAILPFFEIGKYNNLAKNGREAEAKVISYNPTYTHNKHGTTTHHWHRLFYDGSEKRVELKRPHSPEQKLNVVYDPANPSTAAEGKKGMSGPELMGGDYAMMWIMIAMGLFIVFIAFIAPAKSGSSITFGSSSSTAVNPAPESFAGLSDKAGTKTFTFKKEFKVRIPIGIVPGQAQAGPNDFKAAIDTDAPFVPGGPKEQAKAQASPGVFSKYGFEVMDEGYRLYKADKDMAPAALAETFGHLTIGQAKEVIAKADALDYAADDEANNVQGGIYTAEKAAANLMKTNPGFSENLYKEMIKAKLQL